MFPKREQREGNELPRAIEFVHRIHQTNLVPPMQKNSVFAPGNNFFMLFGFIIKATTARVIKCF